MELPAQPLRCPKCHALVVDRRSPTCTTCREALPAEWIMKPDEVTKLMAIDRESRAAYAESMKNLNNPWTQPVNGMGIPINIDPLL